MDQGVQAVVIVATALMVLVLSTADLSIDLLRVDAEQLPPWLTNLTATVTNGRDAEGPGQKRMRRIVEAILTVVALVSPVYILTRPKADASSVTWSVVFWLAAVLWVFWLMRRPRNPVPGSAEESEWETNRASRRAAARAKAKRKRR